MARIAHYKLITNRKLIYKTTLLVKFRSANFKPETLDLTKGAGGEKQGETLGLAIKENSELQVL